jgi:hypothetical protein
MDNDVCFHDRDKIDDVASVGIPVPGVQYPGTVPLVLVPPGERSRNSDILPVHYRR